MKLLLVGDVHATVDSLEECGRLVDFVEKTANEQDVDHIVYLGDIYHTHAILNLYVVDFWIKAFARHKKPVLALVGNHDQPGNHSDNISAMDIHKDNVTVVDGWLVKNRVLFLSYNSDPQTILGTCENFKECGTVICHSTFSGSHYENGFYAKDGINPDLIPQKHIIAGHIHTVQEFGKVWYPGSPRWRTAADANIPKNIWTVEFDSDGIAGVRKPFSTSQVCKQMFAYDDRPEDPIALGDCAGNAVVVNIYGPIDYVDRRKNELKALGVRVRTFPDKRVSLGGVKESEGVVLAFNKYLASYTPKNGTIKSQLLEETLNRVGWNLG
jgi:predicted phosphodiesterase